jgi:hypothetical protein
MMDSGGKGKFPRPRAHLDTVLNFGGLIPGLSPLPKQAGRLCYAASRVKKSCLTNMSKSITKHPTTVVGWMNLHGVFFATAMEK